MIKSSIKLSEVENEEKRNANPAQLSGAVGHTNCIFALE